MAGNSNSGRRPGSGRRRPSDLVLVDLMLRHRGSTTSVALELGFDPRNVRIWTSQPEFKARYRQAQLGLLGEATDVLVAESREAAEAVAKIVKTGKGGAAEQIRLKAAQVIFDAAREALTTAALAEEIAALKAELETLKARARERQPTMRACERCGGLIPDGDVCPCEDEEARQGEAADAVFRVVPGGQA